MNSLGFYFGPKVINVVEAKGKKILNNIQIPNSAFAVNELEDKVPEEIKIVALIKDELRKNQIEAKEAIVTLSSADLIIRTFEIPVLPAGELASAINFEVKKYIPFKIENLVSNFQTRIDKISRKYSVLFIGIKKEILEKYLSILSQLDIKIKHIEYAAFSILRLIELSGYKEKGISALINVDFEYADEADFTVMDDGFPLFSRDIKVSGAPDDASRILLEGALTVSERLKTEIRISLDYYNRKFPARKIKQLFLIGSPGSRPGVEAFTEELGLAFRYIDPAKIIDKSMPFSLSFLKAYGSALLPSVRTSVRINILSTWQKSRQIKEVPQEPKRILSSLVSGFKLESWAAVLAASICVAGFISGVFKRFPLQKELNAIILSRPVISDINHQATYEELKQAEAQYKENISVMDSLVKKRLYLTALLAPIPGLVPAGMWLEGFSFVNGAEGTQFTLEGMAYLGNNNNEMEAINNLAASLKKDANFNGYFKEIKLASVDMKNAQDKTFTHFVISGKN